MVRNFSEYFLGTMPMGDTWKFLSGGAEKGPAVRPFFNLLFEIMRDYCRFPKAVGRFLAKRGDLGPE